MRVRLKGLNCATKRLADGTLRTYWYAWRGGPLLRGEPGTPEFVASYNEAIARRGLPGVSVLTEEFRQAFEAQKSAIGLDAAAVYVPHPMQNRTTAELHAFAEQSIDAILAAICTSYAAIP